MALAENRSHRDAFLKTGAFVMYTSAFLVAGCDSRRQTGASADPAHSPSACERRSENSESGNEAASPEGAANLQLETPSWNHSGCWALAFSPDGRTIAGGWGHNILTDPSGKVVNSWPSKVALWDSVSGSIKRSFGSHGKAVKWLSFSTDDEILVSVSNQDLMAQVWDPATGKEVRTFYLKGPIYDTDIYHKLSLSPDGRHLASVAGPKWQGDVAVWDTHTGRPLWLAARALGYSLAMSPSNQTLAVLIDEVDWEEVAPGAFHGKGGHRYISFFEVDTGKVLSRIDIGRVLGNAMLAFLPDGRTLAALDGESLLRWNMADGKLISRIEFKKGHGPLRLAFTPDGRSAAIVRKSGQRVEFWDLQSGESTGSLDFEPGKWISSPAFSPNLTRMAFVQAFKPMVSELSRVESEENR